MNRTKLHITVFFLAVSVIGLLLSMAHYHSEGLECIEHANEPHYDHSDPVCPVCTLVLYTHVEFSEESADLLFYGEMVTDFEEPFFSSRSLSYINDRAPPEMM